MPRRTPTKCRRRQLVNLMIGQSGLLIIEQKISPVVCLFNSGWWLTLPAGF